MIQLNRRSVEVLLLLACLCSMSLTTASAQVTDDLVEKGRLVAAGDPWLSELREQQTEEADLRGFDAGLAVSEGQTLWGPGKQEFLERLERDEREGFRTSVLFVLDRNRNKELVAAGAAIALGDPASENGRMEEPDVRYRLGFDIASGIFGDPALGARGNTLPGPGSTAIRNALNPVSQRGFDAAARLHLGRNYKPVALSGPVIDSASNRLPRVPNVVGNATQKTEAVAQQLSVELKQLGVDMDPETLNSIASAITKGGESGSYIALGIAFAIAKAKVTNKPEDVTELFQTLSKATSNPDTASGAAEIEAAVKQLTSDPEFLPLDDIETLVKLSPGELQGALAEKIRQSGANMDPDRESSLLKLDQLAGGVFPYIGSGIPSPFELLFNP